MITKKTIRIQIEKLEKEIQWYKEQMNNLYNDAESAECYEDYHQVNLIISDFGQIKGIIKGLQIAIDQLKTLL